MKHKHIILAAVAGLSLIGVAVAQTIAVPTNTNIFTDDLFRIITHGAPVVGDHYVAPKQITAQVGYYKSIPSTGFTLTVPANTVRVLLEPTTTLSTGTVTLPASPLNDGQPVCIYSKNIITTLTLSANTGQTLNDAVTTLGAAGHACYVYSLSNTTWDRAE